MSVISVRLGLQLILPIYNIQFKVSVRFTSGCRFHVVATIPVELTSRYPNPIITCGAVTTVTGL